MIPNIASTFRQHSYIHLPAALSGSLFADLEAACTALFERAGKVLSEVGAGPFDWTAYNREHPDSVIIVPEVSDPRQICRLEYLAGCSSAIREVVRGELAQLICAAIGQPVALFKDKCNLKHPGGGGFGPHQDIIAYRHFAAQYHVTAAVMLEPATLDNGCLEVAQDYQSTAAEYELHETPIGRLPIFPCSTTGDANGDIEPAIANRLAWRAIEAAKGDIILFDSYIPHRSATNRTAGSRKILFFTFNLASTGDHYETYYRAKRQDGDNPIFHVSTPTPHRGRPS